MTELEKMQKIMELAKGNPGKLDEILSKMGATGEQIAKGNKNIVRKESLNNLKNHLGTGFTRFLQPEIDKKSTPKRKQNRRYF